MPPLSPDRRDVVTGTLAALVAGLTGTALTGPAVAAGPIGSMPLGNPEPFSFDSLKARAKALAQMAYKPPSQPAADDPLRGMTFDTFAQAVFKPEM